jgi:hypothetical protein
MAEAKAPSPKFLDDGGDRVDHLIVRRLIKLYNYWVVKSIYINVRLREVRKHKPVTEYVLEADRPDFATNHQRVAWHLGRVHHFFNELVDGKELDPIEVDNRCNRGHIYPIPIIVDGNHRLIAYKLARRPTIPALYSGRVDLLEYLTGKRQRCPD